MKKITLSFFALVFVTAQLSAQEKDLRPSLDIFLQHLQNEIDTQEAPHLVAYFSNCVNSNLNGSEVNYDPEVLLSSSGFDSAAFSRSLQGFQLIPERDDGELCFENTLNPLLSEQRFLMVKTSALNLRKAPSLNSTVLARLDEGVYAGHIDPHLPQLMDEQRGLLWVPVRIEIPSMGWVSAYTVQQYIQAMGPSTGLKIRVAYTQLGWKIISVDRAMLTSENALSSIP